MIGFTILLGAAGIAFGTARLVRADALPFLLGAGFALSLLPLPLERALTLLLIMVLLLLTPVLLTLVGGPSGPTARPAFRTGLLVSQTGELSLILALQGVTLGAVGEEVLSMVLLATAATMLLTPALSKENRVWNRLTRLAPWHRADPEHASDHVLMLGSQGADLPLLDANRDAGGELVGGAHRERLPGLAGGRERAMTAGRRWLPGFGLLEADRLIRIRPPRRRSPEGPTA